MRINDKPPHLAFEKSRLATTGEAAAPAVEQTAVQPAARVSLGQHAAATQASSEKLADAVAARLEQVRQQLKAGTYAVDLDRLASALANDFGAGGTTQ